jgi:spermidine/putrescine transport system substrate-binding protein
MSRQSDELEATLRGVLSRKVTRARFLQMGAGALAASLLSGVRVARAADDLAEGGTLNYYAWTVYTTPEILDPFIAATGTTVNPTTFDSNDAMFAKLILGGDSGFDLVTAAQLLVPQLIELDALERLDRDRVDWSNIDPAFLKQNFDPQDEFTVPKSYGTTGVLYDPVAIDGDIETWEDFLTFGAKPEVAGKVIFPPSAYHVVGIGLFVNGADLNTQDEAEIQAAGDVVKAFAPNIGSFGGYDLDPWLSGATPLGTTNNGNARLAITQRPDLRFVIPKPQSEIWFDTFAMPRGAPNPDQAYSFINFSLRPEQQIAETVASGIPGPLPGLQDMLPADTENKDLIFIPPDVLEYLTPFIATAKTQPLLAQLLTEIKAAAAS